MRHMYLKNDLVYCKNKSYLFIFIRDQKATNKRLDYIFTHLYAVHICFIEKLLFIMVGSDCLAHSFVPTLIACNLARWGSKLKLRRYFGSIPSLFQLLHDILFFCEIRSRNWRSRYNSKNIIHESQNLLLDTLTYTLTHKNQHCLYTIYLVWGITPTNITLTLNL